jgi:hypothetical protein
VINKVLLIFTLCEWNCYLATHFHQNRLSNHVWIRKALLPPSGMNLLKYFTNLHGNVGFRRWKDQFWGQDSLVRRILVDEEEDEDDDYLWTGCRLANKLLALFFHSSQIMERYNGSFMDWHQNVVYWNVMFLIKTFMSGVLTHLGHIWLSEMSVRQNLYAYYMLSVMTDSTECIEFCSGWAQMADSANAGC